MESSRNQMSQTRCLSKQLFAAVFVVLSLLCPNSMALSIKVTDGLQVLFANEKATTTPASIEKLTSFVKTAEQRVAEVIIVVGHAAKVERNPQTLSERRARNIAEQLVLAGVAPSRIYTEGKGFKQTVSQTSSDAYKDRRVEIEFVGLPQRDLRFHGFGFMAHWNDPSGAHAIKQFDAKYQNNDTALQFAKQIQDKNLKQLFLLKLSLYSVLRRDDFTLASVAQTLNLCGSAAHGLPNPYLYAVLWGSAESQKVLQRCNLSKEISNPQRIEVFRRAFCSEVDQRHQLDFDSVVAALFSDGDWTILLLEEHAAQLFTCAMTADRVSWLIKQGVKTPTKQIDGRSVLSVAVMKGDMKSTYLLLNAGADVNEKIMGGNIALHLVARSTTPSFGRWLPLDQQKELWNLLVARGANPDAVNDLGQKPKVP